MDGTIAPRSAGRPRDPTVDRLILDTTVRLLADQGYDAMSIEGIAAAAGIGKTTIYRRYPGKRDVTIAAISSIAASVEVPPDSGDTRADLRRFLGHTFQAFWTTGIGFSMLGTMLVKERSDPELLERFRTDLIRPRIAAAGQLLQRGIDRGELRPDLAPDIVAQLFAGSFFARHVSGQPEDDAWLDAVFETVWAGIAAR